MKNSQLRDQSQIALHGGGTDSQEDTGEDVLKHHHGPFQRKQITGPKRGHKPEKLLTVFPDECYPGIGGVSHPVRRQIIWLQFWGVSPVWR